MLSLRNIILSMCLSLPISVVASQRLPSFSLTPAITPIYHEIYALHITIFWVCVAISVAVFGVMLYFLIQRWQLQKSQANNFHASLTVELLWAVIPFLILVIMAVPTTIVMMHMKNTMTADVNIKVVKLQDKWQYQYVNEGLQYTSMTAAGQPSLVVPVHQRIHFVFDTKSWVHATLMPALKIKREIMPGFIHEAWANIKQPGKYQAKCQDLCGINHGFLPIVVVAKSKKGYQQWLVGMKLHAAHLAD